MARETFSSYIDNANKYDYNIIIFRDYVVKIKDKEKGEIFMSDWTMLLGRTNLRTLAYLLGDMSFPIEERLGDERLEEDIRREIEDDMRIALKHDGVKLEEEVREVLETAWERSEMIGFMEGMRIGARVILALVGDGEIRI